MTSYPIEILPHKSYKKRLNLSVLKNKYSLMAVRWCAVPYESAFEDSAKGTKVLTSSAIGQPLGLSMNLLGGLFDKDKHILYRPTKYSPCRDDWDGISLYTVSCHDFEILSPDGFCLYYDINEWHNYTFPYYTTAPDKATFDGMKAKEKSIALAEDIVIESIVQECFKSKKNPFQMTARTKINHHPTLMNYWHVQLDSYRGNSTEEILDKDKPGSERKKICLLLKNDLKVKYKTDYQVDYHIEKEDYLV